MTTGETGASSIASRILLTDGGWTLVEFVSEAAALEGAGMLRDELTHELGARGEQARAVIVEFTDAEALTRQLAELGEADIAILTQLDRLDARQCEWLDLHRGNFTGGPRVIFLATARAAAQLCTAGNLVAWLGGRHYKFDQTEGVMDVEARLQTLRALHQMDNDTMTRLVKEKSLPLTPEIVEWLILLNRGDLLDD